MTIRKATPEDLPAISAIENVCFPPGISYPLEKLTKEYNASAGRWYVTEIDNKIMGYFWSELWLIRAQASLQEIMETCTHQEDGNVLYIANIAVLPEFRGRNIGKQMTEYMLQELPNVTHAILAVSEENKAAYDIYTSLGFVTLGVLEDYYWPKEKLSEAARIMVLPSKN